MSKASKQDYQEATNAFWKYENNPFEEGSRKHRYFENLRREDDYFTSLNNDMCDTFGIPRFTERKSWEIKNETINI